MKIALLIYTWMVNLFSLLIQFSYEFTLWFNPNLVSYDDEKYFYTLFPTLVNILILFIIFKWEMKKDLPNKKMILISIIFNAFLFSSFIIFQLYKSIHQFDVISNLLINKHPFS